MLQTIREHTQGWIAGIIISIIILTFALWGIHSYFVGGGNTDVVANVNGTNITKGQLAITYERLRRQAQVQNSNNPITTKNESELKKRALQGLIEMEVLKQSAINSGFRISDTQIDHYLQSIPAFQVNGQFSMERFQEVLSSTLLSTNEFLELIHVSLLIDQPKLGIVFTSFALPDEITYNMALVNQERDIDYLNLTFQYFLAQPSTIPADKIKAYYDAHQGEFMTPEQVNVDYLELTFNDVVATIHPSEPELKKFYEDNLSSQAAYNAEKVKEAYVRQHAEEKFAELREQLANITYEHPDSLEAAAKALNLPIKTSSLFTKEQAGTDISQSKKVRDVAFSNDVLNLQNNSDVIQINPETIVVLRIKTHTPSSLLPLNNVSKQIEDKLKLKEVEARAEKLAQEIKTKLQAGADPQQLATSYKLTWTKLGYIGRYSNKVDSAILDMAFRLPNPTSIQNKISYGVNRLASGYAVIALKSVKSGSADSKQYAVFAEQTANSDGLLEYELYKQSQMNKAKITIE